MKNSWGMGMVCGLATAAVVGVVWQSFSQQGGEGGKQPGILASMISSSTRTPAPKYLREIDLITDPGVHWESRIEAVRALPGKLGDASTDKLYAFLEQPPATGEEQWYLVCNEIMEVLRKRNMTPGIYTRKHQELIQAEGAAPVIRDYAAQHLAQWISGVDPGARETDDARVSQAFDAMLSESRKTANGNLTLSGTILNGLCDAVLNGNDAMKGRRDSVATAAMGLLDVEDGSVSSLNRASAMQVAARLHAKGLPDQCRRLLADSSQPADLRLSAIAALGLTGSRQDQTLLEALRADETFKFAAIAALERIGSQSNR